MWDAQKATVKGNPTIQQQNNKQLNLNMIKRIEQAFLQRRYIDGQQAYKTVLNIATNWKMQINEIALHIL